MKARFGSASLEGKNQILNISPTKEQHIVLDRCHPSFASTVKKTNPKHASLESTVGKRESQASKHEKSSVSKAASHSSNCYSEQKMKSMHLFPLLMCVCG